jgi:hypothetical protein
MIALLIVSSCDPLKKQTEENLMKIKLNAKSGFGEFEMGRKVLFPLNYTENKLLKDSIPVAEDFEEYVIRIFNLDEKLAMYKKWKQGTITDQRWEALQRVYKINTDSLVDIKPSNKIWIAYGTLQTGDRAILVDKDLDNDLSDEDLIKIDYPLEFIDDADKDYYLENKDQYLPKVNVEVKYTQQDSMLSQQFPLQINPYNVDELIQYVTKDELEKQYFLSVNIPQYYQSEMIVEKDTFQIEVAGNFKSPYLNKENTQILITNATSVKDSLAQKSDQYTIGDSLYLNKQPYHFKEIALNGSKLLVEKLDDQTELYALKEGYYFPELKKDLIQPDKYQIDDKKPTTYIIWNTKSMNETLVNQLKKWKDEYEDQQLIGIAYDENKGAVKRLLDRMKINWPNYYINPSENQSLKINKKQLPLKIKINRKKQIVKITQKGFLETSIEQENSI